MVGRPAICKNNKTTARDFLNLFPEKAFDEKNALFPEKQPHFTYIVGVANQLFYNQWDANESVTLNNYKVFKKSAKRVVALNVQ